ncbi:unnamed protein product [Moneuplotes crassus]|uniref:Uncharacterized protein n=1 Tax=Euplotes crassus TaxID=5936 RepID=A0AAD1XWV2_EUPCR|nr:unnamed protein product [Moneuplotes crassus]
MKSKNARFKSVKFQTISGILVYLNAGKLSQLDLKQVQKVKNLSFFSKYLSLLKKYAGLLSGDYKFIKGGKTLQKRRIKNFNLSSYKRKLVEKILALESRQLERKINCIFHEPRESSLPSASLEHISKLQSRPGTSIEIYERRRKFLRESTLSYCKTRL